jgi:hypothetical protein
MMFSINQPMQSYVKEENLSEQGLTFILSSLTFILAGLAFSKRGYIMVSVNLPMQTYVKEENLTEEGVIAKLRERGAAPTLYIHSSLRDGAPGEVFHTSLKPCSIVRHLVPVDHYQGFKQTLSSG